MLCFGEGEAISVSPEILQYAEQIDPLVGLCVAAGSFGINYLGSLAIRRTSEGKAGVAANLDTTVLFLNALIVYSFVQNPLYVIPDAVGCWLGSYLCIKLDNRKKVKI